MADQGKLKVRQDIPDQFKWRLEDIYPNQEQWEKDYRQAQQLAGEATAYQGKLGESPQTLLEALQLEEKLEEINEKINIYAHMRRDEDNADAGSQAMADRAENLNTQVMGALAFVAPEILSLPEATLHNFRNSEPGLGKYEFALAELLRQKPHVLSASEEQLLAQMSEVAQAPGNIFRMLNNADLSFPSIKDETGQEIELTHGRYSQLMESHDRRVRRDTFHALYGTYQKLKNTLGATYSSSVKKDAFFGRARKFPSALQASLFHDNVSQEVYDNLIQAVHQNLEAMHRYVRLRKKVLGVDELHMYDIYTPIVKDIKWEIPYPEAVEYVKQGLAPLGDAYAGIMQEGLNSGWVDVYENKGKTSGAYSWGPYGVHPYVLMNYQDNLNNVFTLAHELGHAMHSYFAYREQPYTYAHYTIFTAEVASTVNEALLMNYLLKTVTDHDKKLYLVNYYLEQFRGTVYRQTMFAEFEKITHEKTEAGEALTPELLGQIYYRLNKDYYGPEMVADDEIALEWARIPHFYSAFYVYKYATGFSAATALSRKILNEGEPAVASYLEFLKKGGSDYPLSLLRFAGVDMTTPQPVQEALDIFVQLLDQMEELIGAGQSK